MIGAPKATGLSVRIVCWKVPEFIDLCLFLSVSLGLVQDKLPITAELHDFACFTIGSDSCYGLVTHTIDPAICDPRRLICVGGGCEWFGT